MPLDFDDEYAKGKAGFKIIQYMASSIIPIVSAVGFNNTIIKDGINGFLCKSNNDFYDKLNNVLNLSSEKIVALQKEGLKTVESRFSLELYLKKWDEILS